MIPVIDYFDGLWELGVLANLKDGPARPKDLRRTINGQLAGTRRPLTGSVLSRTLRRMENDGLLLHRDISQTPRVVYYELTVKAYDLIAALDGLEAWHAARRSRWRRPVRRHIGQPGHPVLTELARKHSLAEPMPPPIAAAALTLRDTHPDIRVDHNGRIRWRPRLSATRRKRPAGPTRG